MTLLICCKLCFRSRFLILIDNLLKTSPKFLIRMDRPHTPSISHLTPTTSNLAPSDNPQTPTINHLTQIAVHQLLKVHCDLHVM